MAIALQPAWLLGCSAQLWFQCCGPAGAVAVAWHVASFYWITCLPATCLPAAGSFQVVLDGGKETARRFDPQAKYVFGFVHHGLYPLGEHSK